MSIRLDFELNPFNWDLWKHKYISKHVIELSFQFIFIGFYFSKDKK
jgi:hypothetical protein